MIEIVIHSDGGSRGNPGLAAIGVVAESQGKVLFEISKVIGETTNNIAEYTAVLEGMKELYKMHNMGLLSGVSKISWFLDSQLVVEQLLGRYKIKKQHIKDLVSEISTVRMTLPYPILFSHVKREQNKEADSLVNQAMDAYKD